MSAARAILDFSESQSPWIRDALRRLAKQASLSETDHAELTTLCMMQCGLTDPNAPAACESLNESHLAVRSGGATKVLLNGLRDVKNANRLVANQRLRFAIDGITLVYGDNGSGKSGYCRLLKKLCHVRDGAEEQVLPNAFDRTPSSPAEVTVTYTVGSEVEEVTWRNGSPPPAALHRISVFDSRVSPLYVDKDNKVEYLPFGLDLLPRLGTVCSEIALRLKREIVALEKLITPPVPGYNGTTRAGSVVARLSVTATALSLPTDADLRELALWDDNRDARLGELEQALRGDPLVLAATCERASAASQRIAELLRTACAHVGEEQLSALQTAVEAAKSAREAAEVAAHATFVGEPLPAVGAEAWRLLFEAARTYSQVAYPEQPFPVTSPRSHCVLCQQEIGPEAALRFQRFDEFVRGAAEEHARRCESRVRELSASIETLLFGDPRDVAALLTGFDGADESLARDVQLFVESAALRKKAALDLAVARPTDPGLPALPDSPAERLETESARLLGRALELRNSVSDAAIRLKLTADRDDLRDRLLLSQSLETLLERRTSIERLQRLRKALAACDTAAISRKGTDLRRQFLTEDFERRLRDEVAALGIGYLPLKINDRSERGNSYLGVGIAAVRDVKSDAILSEGERKSLALACFFAEIGGDPDHCGLIFDDPVSSLDHRHRQQVARRIVEEARRGRQVIVLTHDMVLFHELREAAISVTPNVPVSTHEIRKVGDAGFGTVFEEEEPWLSKKVQLRIPVLEQRLTQSRAISDRGSDAYRLAVKAFYTDLRETWERLVEGELLADVVSRFQTEVKTLKLKRVVVEAEDYQAVFVAMKRASRWSGHDRAAAAQTPMPLPEEMADDLNVIKTFLVKTRSRASTVESQRLALEGPPAGRLS